ncbi:MAG: hypothetical protein K2M83_01860 [Muribaculaceae bacterium]|nr:hypothetical protein [Muribaculaceae bacterium]
MNGNTRIVINSIAQFTRTLINVGLGFYGTRIVLEALGEDNYGVYTLVAGVVFLLSFVTNALSTTTQRFLSYHRSSNDISILKTIFSNIIVLHIILGFGILIILEIISPFLFNGFLNIQHEHIESARFSFQCVIFMVLCTCMTSPFRGLLISHQNLIFTSIIDIIDGILKLIIAFVILYWQFIPNTLIEYAILMTIINIFNLLAFSIYCILKYPECSYPKYSDISIRLIKKIIGFAGWLIYSTSMIVGRNQGTAIVLNKFLGTLANTAFGLAVQMNSACMFISSSILNAFNPQIIKTEGEKRHELALRYAQTASKLCYLMMLIVVAPLCVYMEPVIQIWLGDVPIYVVTLGRIIILTTLCDQLTTGLSVINKAIGKLKIYSLTVDTIKIFTVPLLTILLYFNVSLEIAFSSFLIMELLSGLLRLPILKKQAGISINNWIKEVILKLILPTIIIAEYYKICDTYFQTDFLSIIAISLMGSIILILSSYHLALSINERRIVNGLILSLIHRIKHNDRKL